MASNAILINTDNSNTSERRRHSGKVVIKEQQRHPTTRLEQTRRCNKNLNKPKSKVEGGGEGEFQNSSLLTLEMETIKLGV